MWPAAGPQGRARVWLYGSRVWAASLAAVMASGFRVEPGHQPGLLSVHHPHQGARHFQAMEWGGLHVLAGHSLIYATGLFIEHLLRLGAEPNTSYSRKTDRKQHAWVIPKRLEPLICECLEPQPQRLVNSTPFHAQTLRAQCPVFRSKGKPDWLPVSLSSERCPPEMATGPQVNGKHLKKAASIIFFCCHSIGTGWRVTGRGPSKGRDTTASKHPCGTRHHKLTDFCVPCVENMWLSPFISYREFPREKLK